MNIRYTIHSEYQIKKRKMEKIWIEDALKNPDYTYKEDNLYYAQKKFNGLKIEVVYEKQKYIKVITVYWL